MCVCVYVYVCAYMCLCTLFVNVLYAYVHTAPRGTIFETGLLCVFVVCVYIYIWYVCVYIIITSVRKYKL